ncbi:MAG: type II secretion system F family protein [Lentisphaeria bacterium]|nr:type II secretion system F family protein [Lentisphaeria bacterium]
MEKHQYRYLVLDGSGRRRERRIEAESAVEARRRLRALGMIPLRELDTAEKKSSPFRLFRRSRFDALAFTNRLAPLLAANVPLEKALMVIEKGMSEPESREICFELRRRLHGGERFSRLVRDREDLFPPLYAGLIEAGEETGALNEVVAELRRFLNESREFRDFVVTSSIYPAVVAGVTVGVVLLLFTVFIPRFAQVFADMDQELPALTKIMLDISSFLVTNWYLIPLTIVGLILLHWRLRQPGKLRYWRDTVILKTPLLGALTVSVQIGNFLQAMAIMCRNHVHLLTALRIARNTLSNDVLQRAFDPVAEQLRDGGKLSEVLGEVIWLPPGAAAMLRVAEESGDIGAMFEKIALEEQNETRIKFKRLLAMLEPLIIVVLALMVLTVVLAVFMAIWKMNAIR